MSTDPHEALADLLELSSQIEAAVVLGADGPVAGPRMDDERAERLARAAERLLEAAEWERGGGVAYVEVSLRDGSVFVVREAGRTIAATTCAAPTSALVLYDLRACLRRLAEPRPAKRERGPNAGESADAAA